MAPTATQTETITQTPIFLQTPNKMVAVPSSTDHYIPLQLSGALKQFEQTDLTPLIGTRFETINLTEILHSPVCDQLIRDIAITSELFRCKPVQDIFPSPRQDTSRLYIQPSAFKSSHVPMPFFQQLTWSQSPSAASVYFPSKIILPSKIRSCLLVSLES